MALYVKLLLRYRDCVGDLKTLYEESQQNLTRKEELISHLTVELREATNRHTEHRSNEKQKQLSLSEEIVKLKSELETTREVIQCIMNSEAALLEARTRIVEEKSASLSLRQRLKLSEATCAALKEEAEAKQRVVEQSYKIKMEVLLNTINKLEEAQERLDVCENDNIVKTSQVQLLEKRVKDLTVELDSYISMAESERSSINGQLVSLTNNLEESETKCVLLEAELVAVKRQRDSSQGIARTLTMEKDELLALVDRTKEANVLELKLRDMTQAMERERQQVESLSSELEKCHLKIDRLEARKEVIKQQRKDLVELFRNKLRDK